jgi:Bromodomain
MNQTDYQNDSNRGSANPQNASPYDQYQWQQQHPHQPQLQPQQAKVVTHAAYDHDATHGSDIQETSKLLSNVFTNAAKGTSAPMGSYSPQSYQQHSLAKHPSMSMANTSALSMFQDTSLWNPQEWMSDDQKQDRNGPIARYPTDASIDNKRMKYADWGRSSLLSTSSQPPRDEDPSSMTSRASSYQISDDVIQMFHTPSVLGLHAEHDSPRLSVESGATASHYSQVPNAPLHMQVDSHPFVDMPYEPVTGNLLQTNSASQSLNGSSNPQSQTHNRNDGFASVYIAEDNSQDMQGLNMADTSYMYPDHHQKDDRQHMQTFSPVSAKPASILRQPDVFPYGNQYPSQNDLEEQQKKRRRDSFGGGLGMPIDRQSNVVNDEGQLETSSAMPKRFRLTVQNTIPTMNAGPHYGGNPLYGNAMETSDSRMPPYGVQAPTSTPPVDQEFASYSQSQPTSPSSIKRLPNIKLVLKEPKVAKEYKPGKESKAHEDVDDDDFSETHVAETTVRQTSSVKPVATEASINQCSFVTDNAMLDTISVRKCNYILNQIYSTGCCLPFVLPVPKVLALYHSVITNPSDLSSVENRLWNSGYSSTDEFHHDIAMIWRNAEAFHKNGGDIADKAQLLKQVYFDALQQLEVHRYVNDKIASANVA